LGRATISTGRKSRQSLHQSLCHQLRITSPLGTTECTSFRLLLPPCPRTAGRLAIVTPHGDRIATLRTVWTTTTGAGTNLFEYIVLSLGELVDWPYDFRFRFVTQYVRRFTPYASRFTRPELVLSFSANPPSWQLPLGKQIQFVNPARTVALADRTEGTAAEAALSHVVPPTEYCNAVRTACQAP